MKITIHKTTLEVDFDVSPYHSATRFEPAEYSELSIKSVTAEGDITALLSDYAIGQITTQIELELTQRPWPMRQQYRFHGPRP